MLHHFVRVSLPQMRVGTELPVNFTPLLMDLKPYSNAPSDVTWATTLSTYKEQLATATGLTSEKAWWTLAQPELVDAEGNLKPDISTSSDSKAAARAVVHQATDPIVFLRRTAWHLANQQVPSVLLLVLDNIDVYASAPKQLEAVKAFETLLAEVPAAIGILTVREYTLGNLGHLEDFAAFRHVDRMHVTSPRLGQVIEQRFRLATKDIDEVAARSQTVKIAEGATVSQFDARAIFSHIGAAFDGLDGAEKAGEPSDSNDTMRDLGVFLNHVSNSNVRASLGLVLSALQSSCLQVGDIVSTYLVQRDKHQPISLPRFTVDDMMRLACVGEYKWYNHDECEQIHNIFTTGNSVPIRKEGRFPLLHRYRILQAIRAADDHIGVDHLFDLLHCFPYSKLENWDEIAWLLEAAFIESEDGSELKNIRTICGTRKLRAYLDFVGCSLVYLENVRNDSYIEYEAVPHEFDCSLAVDMIETIKFVRYVMETEEAQYAFVAGDGAKLQRFKRIAVDQPVCWKVLKRVGFRCQELCRRDPTLIPAEYRRTVVRSFLDLRSDIQHGMNEGRLYPSAAHERLFFDLS